MASTTQFPVASEQDDAPTQQADGSITLPAFDGDASRYSIASPETLTVRLPAVALAGARDRMGAALFAALADGDSSFNKKDEFTPAYEDAFAEAAYISNFFDYFDSQLDGQYDGEVTEAELLSGLTSLAEKAGEVWGGEIGAFLAASARLAADDGLAASPSLLILAEATPIDLALGSGMNALAVLKNCGSAAAVSAKRSCSARCGRTHAEKDADLRKRAIDLDILTPRKPPPSPPGLPSITAIPGFHTRLLR